ncbi:MAG: hypothetical protein CVT49_03365 [candidate division Zixibacteria bacterium HGW-Zixibacteria-1]|nr:MAG: hypothetical protein CVT49_03365 [candidate division Zixibacteria bacterium HGW-Zixibacteria-1]
MTDLKQILVACGLDEKKYSRLFKAFGDPTRQKIMVFLSTGEKTVNEIAKAVGVSQPTTSRHLAIMRDAGIVVDRRDGQRIYHRLEKVFIKNCCVGFCDCLEVKVVKLDEKKPEKKPQKGKK